jgi:tellurite resistance protein TehA-like permease
MVKCFNCGKKFTNPDDVNVLALMGVYLTPTCNKCYAARLREYHGNIFFTAPLNGEDFSIGLFWGTVLLTVVTLGSIIWAALSLKSIEKCIWLAIIFLICWAAILWPYKLLRDARNIVKSVKTSHKK